MEIVLAIAIFAIFSLGIFYLSIDTIQRDSKIELNNIALFYAQEGLEAIRNMRDRNYLSITNGDHGLSFQNDTWSFVAAPETIDGFYQRTITISDVYRDVNDAIATTGTFDPETKLVASEITWNWKSVVPQSVTLSSYISNWTGTDFIQTTCGEFNTGTFSNTENEVVPSPPNDNCSVKLSDVTQPSQFFASSDVGEHGEDVVIDGNYAYVATAKSQKGFTIVNVTNRALPTIASQLYVWNKGRKLVKDGNKVYLGIEVTNPAIAIINVTNPATPSVTYSWQLNGKGNTPAVSGNYLYATADSSTNGFVVYNISGTPAATDFLSVGAKVHTAVINGNYAYLGVDTDHSGLRVISISNPANVSQVASLDVDEEVNAIVISGVFAFLGTEDDDNALKVVNISNPLAPTLVTSLDVGDEIQDLVIEGDYLYAAVDDQNAGLAAVNIQNPAAPMLAYTLDVQGKGTGIDADQNYIYIATDTSNKGLVIIGTTQSGVTNSGNYTSQIFDTTSTDTRYNFIEWDHTEVPGGSVKFQIRTASTSAGINSATWVGSDGTANTYYTTSRTPIVLSPGASGKRYIQYKAFFTSDGSTSPSLHSVRINYNP